ncbi:hypothetical protein C9374_002631 [Naegleria lovaniensis]|uniref:TAFII28-like protein domain-containing protein n=1 Tax=Naegleria lovaniensis TaxID=51637 RepID=A0AA88KJZ2_NAELO|nr:uncharacterized protein C9374_002631 [Naegleria lovaniensis]KAG2386185.1 hypothetical protein C9374_002631 [Naegleria lovaniensis]
MSETFSLPSTFSAQDLGTTTFRYNQFDDEDNIRQNNEMNRQNNYEDDEESRSDSGGSEISEDEYGGDHMMRRGDMYLGPEDDDEEIANFGVSASVASSIKKRKRRLRKLKEKRESEKKERLIAQLSSADHPQYERYECFIRSTFKPVVKRLISGSTNVTANKHAEIIIAGIAKVFVGEMVELAKSIQKEWGDDVNAPIEPKHLREAYRRTRESQNRKKKYAFR